MQIDVAEIWVQDGKIIHWDATRKASQWCITVSSENNMDIHFNWVRNSRDCFIICAHFQFPAVNHCVGKIKVANVYYNKHMLDSIDENWTLLVFSSGGANDFDFCTTCDMLMGFTHRNRARTLRRVQVSTEIDE
jgi:hypothetical protein